MIVQNMPGAGSLVALNYVYGVVKPDGLTTSCPTATFIWSSYRAIKKCASICASSRSSVRKKKITCCSICARTRRTKPSATSSKRRKPPKCGSTGVGSAGYVLDRVLDVAFGAKINTVMGYPGGNEIDLAVEKGEIQCRGNTILPHFGREPFDTWHKKGFDRHLDSNSAQTRSVGAEAPTIYELMDQYKTSESNRRLANVLLGGAEFGRFMLVTPGTPPDRVKMLREAYAESMKDPELIAEAKKGRMDMDPSTGEELQALLQEIMDQPPDVIERMKKILSE